jgi:predicted RNase H-like HicB family nuclease
MVAPADQPRRVLHYQAAVIPDGDGGFTARCLELGWLCTHDRTVEEALARLRELVELELSHRLDRPWPLFAIVVPFDVLLLRAPMTATAGLKQARLHDTRQNIIRAWRVEWATAVGSAVVR